jgi:hypothetical protein
VDVDDKDLHIDMSGVDEIMREEESVNLKRESQQSIEIVTKTTNTTKKSPPQESKKKRNGNARKEGKRRTTKLNSKEEVVVIEKALPTPSPWVTVDPSITADISLEQRQLIEFYVNPLEGDLPHAIDIR